MLNDETRRALMQARLEAAQVRLMVSKARIVIRAASAASTSPVGAKKTGALIATIAAVSGVNGNYVNMIKIMSDKKALLAQIDALKKQAVQSGFYTARREVYKAIGTQIRDLNMMMQTYVEMRDTTRQLVKTVKDAIKLTDVWF